MEKEQLWEPKVGDWIVITKSNTNWSCLMDQFVGKCVQITRYDGYSVKFKDSGHWFWFLGHGHFREATPEEIAKEKGESHSNYEIF